MAVTGGPTRLRVDPVACDAFGHCAEIAPALIGLDEWGYPVLDDVDVPPGLRQVARRAVAACPRRALFLQAARSPEEGAHLGLDAVPTPGAR